MCGTQGESEGDTDEHGVARTDEDWWLAGEVGVDLGGGLTEFRRHG